MTPALFLAAALASNAQAEVVVIVSAKSHVARLTADQAAKIFLGKTSTFPGDGDAVPVDQAEGSAIREEFYAKVVRKSSSQVSAYWAKVIFTGDGHPPEIFESNTAVKKAVAKNPNAIGYIDKSTVDKSVRVILDP
jgi:ABC-type phosphate transport system substrate-binding protein